MERILAFAGRAELTSAFDPAVVSPENHMLEGNPIRYDRAAPRIAADEAWREGLRLRPKLVALGLTWPLLLAYGYIGPGGGGMGERRPRVLYVAGAGRSGSTLLCQLLGSVPGVVGIGEFSRFWTESFIHNWYCGCGERLRECPWWTAAVEEALGGWEAVEGRQFHRAERVTRQRWGLAATLFPALRRRQRATLERALAARVAVPGRAAACGGSPVVDISKHPQFLLALANTRALDLRVVQLVRDSRAVGNSWRRTILNPRPDDEDRRMATQSARSSAVHWVYTNAVTELLVRPRLPTKRVYYRDLCANPERTVAEIMRFAGRADGRMGSRDAAG